MIDLEISEPFFHMSDLADEKLIEFEQQLFDDEFLDGCNTWPLREQVLIEMRKRGLI